MLHRVRLQFREKLLLIFFVLSVIPLVAVAYLVSNTVQNSYKDTLTRSFESYVDFREKILTYYFESNKVWIKSIAAQDVFLAEMEKYATNESYSQNRIFASLVSLKRENQFINKIYIADKNGKIISSTTTDDEGENVNASNDTVNSNLRTPYYHKIRTNSEGSRIITLTTPFIRRNNGEVIGNLVVEYNASVVKSLRDGSIYNSQSINENVKSKLGETYIIDEDNYLLTSISGTNIEKTPRIKPIEGCEQGVTLETAQWTNKDNKEVFGSYLCKSIDQMRFVFIVEEEITRAFAVGNNIRNTIVIITASIGLLLIVSILKVASSVTDPVKQLAKGAQEFGKGNFNYPLQITTGDELEELATSFTEMAKKVNAFVNDLKKQEDQLNQFNTELKSEKEKISAERNKLEVIIAGISDAVIALNMDREVVICNKAAQELIELSQEEIIGKKINELITLEDENGPLSENMYSPIRTDDFEGAIYHNDNLTFRSSARKSARVKLITGKIKEGVSANLGCILTFHDMHSEAELEEMKMDFVSMAAHELRTPITSIRGYANLLADEIEETAEPKYQEWNTLISRISISAEQLLALVENLLNVTKIEKGILTIAQKNENWSQCVMDVANEFKERAASKQITLNIKEPDTSLIAYVDKLRINEVITNLISNAINYTQNGGTINVEAHTSADGNWIETSVSDNGKGIPKSAQTHLFEKFFRVTGPLEQGSKGNGLGLYISKSIVEMHGGKIWVESDEGKGAKFSYTVQRVKAN